MKKETKDVDPSVQLDAWSEMQQGTERWHKLRACRVTASNFGSVHRTNTYSTSLDLLRNMLWPASMDSVAMRYGSISRGAHVVCSPFPTRRPLSGIQSSFSGPKGRLGTVFGVAFRTCGASRSPGLHRRTRYLVVRTASLFGREPGWDSL